MVVLAPIDLRAYRRIVVLTGAGISVASGLRPYRGPGGLWNEHPELLEQTTAAAFARDPMSIWRTFGAMRSTVDAAQPNPAHVALARAELTVITQNIDGLHQRAGSRRVIELHGNIMRTRCSSDACELPSFEDHEQPAELPRCPRCGGALRPDVVLFDEPIPARPGWDARQALRGCDLFMAIGTSGSVSPAANFVRSAEYEGARTVFINLEPLDPPNPMFHETYLGCAEELLPTLLRA
jgi:NAD-dependent deacetylase